jgi:hypothetical protein
MSTGTPCGDPPFDPPYRNLITGKMEFGPMPTPQPIERPKLPDAPDQVEFRSESNKPGAVIPGQLRDYFAGQALLISGAFARNPGIEAHAEAAYRLADAMMAERAKRSA